MLQLYRGRVSTTSTTIASISSSGNTQRSPVAVSDFVPRGVHYLYYKYPVWLPLYPALDLVRGARQRSHLRHPVLLGAMQPPTTGLRLDRSTN